MPIRDERTFSDEEFARAFSFVMSPAEARAEAIAINSAPDLKGFETASPEELRAAPACGPRSYGGDVLDLLSLVSNDCARRAWAFLGVTAAEGARRRLALRSRLDVARGDW